MTKNLPAKRSRTEIQLRCDKCGLTWWYPVNALPFSCPNCYKTPKRERAEDTIRRVVRDFNDLFSHLTGASEYGRGKSHLVFEETRIYTYSAGDPECDVALNTIFMKEGDKVCHSGAKFVEMYRRAERSRRSSSWRRERKPTQPTTLRQSRPNNRGGGR